MEGLAGVSHVEKGEAFLEGGTARAEGTLVRRPAGTKPTRAVEGFEQGQGPPHPSSLSTCVTASGQPSLIPQASQIFPPVSWALRHPVLMASVHSLHSSSTHTRVSVHWMLPGAKSRSAVFPPSALVPGVGPANLADG